MASLRDLQSMATNMFSAYASMAASMMLFRTFAKDILPGPVKSFLYNSFGSFIKHLMDRFFPKKPTLTTIVIDEEIGILRNQIYDAAEIYLGTKDNPDSDKLRASKSPKQSNINLSIVKDQNVSDRFNGFELKWQFVLVEPQGERARFQPEKRYFELTFEKSNKDAVVNDYLPFVLSTAKEIKERHRAVKLYSRDCQFNNDEDGNGCGSGNRTWGCVNLNHPVSFEKLAMDPSLKRSLIEDLDRFLRRKEYYNKVGKAWKRGYLLYGPPGTGKSSLVAAIANYLKFDVYDLELTSVYSNSELRRTLLSTNSKSIIVIEDIDCSAEMHNRGFGGVQPTASDKLTLSGVLNLIDGLWSTCGDERIIIFTTNHKEKLDPALLRPGRMDMHVHMGYCTPEGFDVLATNYLGVNDQRGVVLEIKDLIREIEVTPAEIAEHLLRNEDVDLALQGVLDLLVVKKEEKERVVLEKEANKEEEKSKVVGEENRDTKEKKSDGEFMMLASELVMGTKNFQRLAR